MSVDAKGSADAFLNLLIAAMHDAALERKLTQLATQLNPDGKGLKRIRIIVIPEEPDITWPSSAPLGSAGRDQ